MTPTPSGKGYWMVGTDGAVFPYGDAAALGSASALRSVAALASTPTGAGYWAVGADGSLAAFGDAADLGRPTGQLAKPIVGMAVVPASDGSATGGPAASARPAAMTCRAAKARPAPPARPGPEAVPVDHGPALGDRLPALLLAAARRTYGTTAQLGHDPSHPLREPCYQDKCDDAPRQWHNARFAEELRSIAVIGNRLFIGGFFHELIDHATPPPGEAYHKPVAFLAELDARTGQPAANWTFTENAAPDASVAAMAISPDDRRLYIGGRFIRAGGGESRRIAALDLQTGLLDPTFKPPSIDQNVHAIALSPDGNRIFIGGNFLQVGGKQVPSVAALNYDGSMVEGWTAPPNYGGSFVGQAGDPVQAAQGAVDALVVTGDGRYLMVGGDFLHLGTRPEDDKQNQKSGLVALHTTDGSLAPWRPHNNRPVFDLELSYDKTLVLSAQGGAGGALVAHRPDQEERVFLKHVDGDALTLAVTDQRIYFGGHWDVEVEDPDEECLKHVPVMCHAKGPYPAKSATLHRHLAAFHPNGDIDNTWTAQTDTAEGPNVMVAGPNGLYLAGNFFNTLNDHFLNGGKQTWHPGFALLPGHPVARAFA